MRYYCLKMLPTDDSKVSIHVTSIFKLYEIKLSTYNWIQPFLRNEEGICEKSNVSPNCHACIAHPVLGCKLANL